MKHDPATPFGFTSPIHANAWSLDPAVVMLNHGSFGACPRQILERQTELRSRMEAEPVRFLVREMPALWDQSRQSLAALVGTEAESLAFVTNATAGVNAVLRSLRFRPGDELLFTDHGYNACNNVVRYVAEREGATLVVVNVPIPIESPEQVVEAILARVTDRTRIAVLDHVTSPTAVVFPIPSLVRALAERGIDTLVDGAHVPGMLPLELNRLEAAYYVGNCHKWLCAPKGAGFLYVRPDRQDGIQAPVVSHGYNQPRPGYSRFQDAFDWQGTVDPTAWLCVGEAIAFLASLLPGGIQAVMQRNHNLTAAVTRMLAERLPLRPACPETMLGSMAAFILPPGADRKLMADLDSLGPVSRSGNQLLDRHGIEVPVYHWPAPPQAILRVSVQAYNDMGHYMRLADALEALLKS